MDGSATLQDTPVMHQPMSTRSCSRIRLTAAVSAPIATTVEPPPSSGATSNSLMVSQPAAGSVARRRSARGATDRRSWNVMSGETATLSGLKGSATWSSGCDRTSA